LILLDYTASRLRVVRTPRERLAAGVGSPKPLKFPAIRFLGKVIHSEALRWARKGDDAVSDLVEECG